jgi:hypothetical protein
MKHSPLQWIQRKSETPPSDDSHLIDSTGSPDDAKSGKKRQWAVDTFTLALDLAEQALAIAEVAPVFAPAATLVRKIIDSYEVSVGVWQSARCADHFTGAEKC